MTVAQAEEMIEVCNHRGVKLGCAFMMRFVAQHQEALQLIQQGRLGRPVYARAQLSCWYPPIEDAWRQDPATGGGGSLMDMGGHCIDLLEMFFGKVAKVSCLIGNTIHNYRSEDSAVATLFFENGALATVDTFFCIPDAGSKNVLELYGSKGSILAQGTIGQGPAGKMVAFLEGDDRAYDAQQARGPDQGVPIEPKPSEHLRGRDRGVQPGDYGEPAAKDRRRPGPAEPEDPGCLLRVRSVGAGGSGGLMQVMAGHNTPAIYVWWPDARDNSS